MIVSAKFLYFAGGHDVVDWDLLGAVMVTKMLEQVSVGIGVLSS